LIVTVGSGIFSSPGPVLLYSNSVGLALVIWLAAGLLAITGALCYAELGTMMPTSGGEHPYLLKAYGQLPAFLFSWTGITVTRPGSTAIITTIFAEYVCRLIYYEHEAQNIPPLLVKFIAMVCIIVLALVNALSSKLGAMVQNIFTVMKLLSLLAIGIVATTMLAEHATKVDNFHEVFRNSTSNPGDVSLALYSALWAYDGWNNLNLVTGELENPSRNLPLAVTIGPAIVIICYLLTNFAYYAVLPASTILKTTSIAMDFGKAAFGKIGGILIPLAVIGSTFSAANGGVFTSARIVYVSSKSGHAPKFLGEVNTRTHTPINALVQQAGFSIVFVMFGSFNSLVNLYSMIAWSFYILAVLALIILRWKEPELRRPYKVWWSTPILFCITSTFLVVISVIEAPVEGLGACLFLGSGIPVWYFVVDSTNTMNDLKGWISDRWARLRGQRTHANATSADRMLFQALDIEDSEF